jgi:glutathione S-transferase
MTQADAPMRLYYNPFSSSARRAVMTALELQLPVELVLIKNLREPNERAQLLALNPNAKIPVLVQGDFVLWESTAIMQYFADQVPGQTLYPTELQARADVHRWLAWGTQHWAPSLGVLTWEKWMKGMFGLGAADAHEVARGERDLAQFAAVLDQHLDGREWLSGPRYTLADFALATPLMRSSEAAISLAPYPHVVAWYERVQGLDVWQRTKP